MSTTLALARIFPPRVGGSGRWMWEIYSRMQAGDCLVVAGNDAAAAEYDRTHDVPTIRLPLDLPSWGALGLRRGADYLRVYHSLIAIARKHHVGAVHAACVLPEGFLAWLLQRRLGTPYLVYVHGEELNVARTSRELTWMTRRVLQRACAVVANCQNTAELLKAEWPIDASKMHVLHPAVDATLFYPAARDLNVRAALGWGDRPVILTTGRLQKRKGHAHLFRALPAVCRDIPDVLAAVVGDGDERERLEEIVAEQRLSANVVFHGELNGDLLVTAYQQCELFVLPNYEVDGDIEGFGLVLLEAQSCGKPVIAGKSGGTAETMDEPRTGMLLDCTDAQLLAASIVELLQDSSRRRRMGELARTWVLDHFNLPELNQKARDVFSTIPQKLKASASRPAAC